MRCAGDVRLTVRPPAFHRQTRPALEVTLRDEGGGVVLLDVRGELDLLTADELRQGLHDALAQAHRVIVDLRGVTFIDSTGVVVLVRAQRALGPEQTLSVHCAKAGPVDRLFARINAGEIFAVHETA